MDITRLARWHFPWNRYIPVGIIIALLGFSFNVLSITTEVIKYAPNPSYDNIPITPTTWEEVDLIYYSTISGHRYTNTIQILRPIAWLHKHHMDTTGSKVTFSIPEFSIVNIMATVKDIKPIQIDTRDVDWSKQKSAPVIGKFIHYVTDIRTYTFKDSHGHISHINATLNHPFYVKNRHGFVAIENVSSKDTLMGLVGFGDKQVDGVAHLVCAKGLHNHCGLAFVNGRLLPTPVYNAEVYGRHVYRVGVGSLLVHNGCDESLFQGKELLSPKRTLVKDILKDKYTFSPEIVSNTDIDQNYWYKFIVNKEGEIKLSKYPDNPSIRPSHAWIAEYDDVRWAGDVIKQSNGEILFTSVSGAYHSGKLEDSELINLARRFSTIDKPVSRVYQLYATKRIYDTSKALEGDIGFALYVSDP